MGKIFWVTYGSVSQLHVEYHAHFFLYAQNREEVTHLLDDFRRENNADLKLMLAPLPAETWFERHGALWLLSYIDTARKKRLVVIPKEEKPAGTIPVETKDYLRRCILKDFILLDDQTDRYPKLFAPEPIFRLLWPDKEIPDNIMGFESVEHKQPENPMPKEDPLVRKKDIEIFGTALPPLACYAVIDSGRCPNSAQLLDRYRNACLVDTTLQARNQPAPYLVELFPEQISGLSGLFTDRTYTPFLSWQDQAGIFLHSRHDFDTVLKHLRQFACLLNEEDEKLFFRFHDPIVLQEYLEAIAEMPEKLSTFLGYQDRIIHAFASGYDDSFHYYMVDALDDIDPAPVVMTNWEIDALGEQKWEKRARPRILAEVLSAMEPTGLPVPDKQILKQWLDDALYAGYVMETALYRYLIARIYAEHNAQDFITLDKEIPNRNKHSDMYRSRYLWDHTVENTG